MIPMMLKVAKPYCLMSFLFKSFLFKFFLIFMMFFSVLFAESKKIVNEDNTFLKIEYYAEAMETAIENDNEEMAIYYGEKIFEYELLYLDTYPYFFTYTALILADLYFTEGSFSDAEQLYLKALPFLENDSNVDRISMFRLYHHLGLIKQSVGNYYESLGYYKQALKLVKRSYDYAHQVSIYLDLGRLHAELQEDLKALHYYKKGLAILHKQDKTIHLEEFHIAIHTEMAFLYHRMSNFNQAIAHYERLYSLDPESGFFIYELLGDAYRSIKKYKKAQFFYDEAYKQMLDEEKFLDLIGTVDESLTILAKSFFCDLALGNRFFS